MNELIAQPKQKTKFYLSFVTLLVGVVAGSHTAIAQTGAATQKPHRLFDGRLVAHQHLSTQELDSRKNFNLPNSLIAGDERRNDLDERHNKPHDKRREKPHSKDDSGKSTGDSTRTVLPMPKPHLDDGSGTIKEKHIIMPKPRIDTGGD